MPNHETNNVVILGEPAKIRAFVTEAFIHPGQPYPDSDAVNSRDFPALYFPLIVPEPENIERGGCNGRHDPGVVCWYEWNLENWGTKWGAYSHSHYALRFLREYGEDAEVYGRVDLRFETAWSQPTPIFEAIEKRWGVTVHAITQDEGGFPDVEFGDPSQAEVLSKVVTYEFETWDIEVDNAASVSS